MKVFNTLFKYMVISGTLTVVSVFVSLVLLDFLMHLMGFRVDVNSLVWVAVCIGVVVSVLYSIVWLGLLYLIDDRSVRMLMPLLNFQRQIDSLNLKISEGEESIETLSKLKGEIEASVQAMDRLTKLSHAINQQFSTLSDQEIDALRQSISKQLRGCVLEFTKNGWSVIWNSLPYHQHFESFDDEDKVAYFNAIQTGNWQPLRRRSKAKWID